MVFPIFDGSNLYVLLQWLRTGRLDRLEHHVMNACFLTSKVMAAMLLFLAHDAYYVFEYPGVGSLARLGLQLAPQLMFLGPYLLRIGGHVLRAGQHVGGKQE